MKQLAPAVKSKLSSKLIVLAIMLLLFAIVYYLHGFTIPNFRSKYQGISEYGELNGPEVSATDTRVIKRFRSDYLIAPDLNSQYNVTGSESTDPSMGQSVVIRRLFKNKSPEDGPGFFIECGALDGETRSNTLYLERQLGWKGLLIEADPKNFKKLLTKNRHAWMSPTCLSIKSYPMMVSFHQGANLGKIAKLEAGYLHSGFVDVQCFPLESMLVGLNITTVDYFSLDVEGAELDVLRTIPFNKFDIKTLSVEFIHDVEGKDAIKEHMTRQGYVLHSEVTHPGGLANDFIFIKKTFLDQFSSAEKNSIRRDILVQRNNFGGDIQVYVGDDRIDGAGPDPPVKTAGFNKTK